MGLLEGASQLRLSRRQGRERRAKFGSLGFKIGSRAKASNPLESPPPHPLSWLEGRRAPAGFPPPPEGARKLTCSRPRKTESAERPASPSAPGRGGLGIQAIGGERLPGQQPRAPPLRFGAPGSSAATAATAFPPPQRQPFLGRALRGLPCWSAAPFNRAPYLPAFS